MPRGILPDVRRESARPQPRRCPCRPRRCAATARAHRWAGTTASWNPSAASRGWPSRHTRAAGCCSRRRRRPGWPSARHWRHCRTAAARCRRHPACVPATTLFSDAHSSRTSRPVTNSARLNACTPISRHAAADAGMCGIKPPPRLLVAVLFYRGWQASPGYIRPAPCVPCPARQRRRAPVLREPWDKRYRDASGRNAAPRRSTCAASRRHSASVAVAGLSESTWKPWSSAALAMARCVRLGVTMTTHCMRSVGGQCCFALEHRSGNPHTNVRAQCPDQRQTPAIAPRCC